MQAFARGSKKEPVFGKIQKSFFEHFCHPTSCEATREATLRHVITAPLAAELIQPIPAHPVVVADPPSLPYSHNSHIAERTARSTVPRSSATLALLARAWEGR